MIESGEVRRRLRAIGLLLPAALACGDGTGPQPEHVPAPGIYTLQWVILPADRLEPIRTLPTTGTSALGNPLTLVSAALEIGRSGRRVSPPDSARSHYFGDYRVSFRLHGTRPSGGEGEYVITASGRYDVAVRCQGSCESRIVFCDEGGSGCNAGVLQGEACDRDKIWAVARLGFARPPTGSPWPDAYGPWMR